ncbi:hypothetical protein [Streptomyces sp. cg35]|uniref:hypothetical protein n=1 Tax=Streptomyces sp. cg35 TaxID=3421650 RepID=UPI003D178304
MITMTETISAYLNRQSAPVRIWDVLFDICAEAGDTAAADLNARINDLDADVMDAWELLDALYDLAEHDLATIQTSAEWAALGRPVKPSERRGLGDKYIAAA